MEVEWPVVYRNEVSKESVINITARQISFSNIIIMSENCTYCLI
jgi:hypothetical protein